MTPFESIRMPSMAPAAAPFCVVDDVADGDAKALTVGAPFVSYRFQLKFVAVAPLAQAGLVIVTAAAGFVRLPVPSNVSEPVPICEGVPGVPPVTSAPGTVIE